MHGDITRRRLLEMRVSFFFAWFDAWVGFYYDKKKRILYFNPLPFCVFKIELEAA